VWLRMSLCVLMRAHVVSKGLEFGWVAELRNMSGASIKKEVEIYWAKIHGFRARMLSRANTRRAVEKWGKRCALYSVEEWEERYLNNRG